MNTAREPYLGLVSVTVVSQARHVCELWSVSRGVMGRIVVGGPRAAV